MRLLKKPGPLAQMTLAMVMMMVSILMLAQLLLGLTPDIDRQRQQLRRELAESLAVQAAAHLGASDMAALERSLREAVRRVPDLDSIGVRRAGGELVVTAGPHERSWHGPRDDPEHDTTSTVDDVRVPLSANGRPWGRVEMAFRPSQVVWWQRLLYSPLVHQLLFVTVLGSFGFALYMRRALQHLDPSSVIPERVQRAFDAMAEGVVVLDARARVMLANKAFRTIDANSGALRIGQTLSSLPWLATAIEGDVSQHPWTRSMSSGGNILGEPITLKAAPPTDGDTPVEGSGERRIIVSCAPITDRSGTVRGCMATFNDQTELHAANVALEQAMFELEAGREELRLNNVRLQQLATRDALTGCLNRRAFMDSAPLMLDRALSEGRTVGCLMMDIDHFKSINDTHGHGVGDRVIAETARIMLGAVRDGDLVARYGGEEFCVFAPYMTDVQLCALGERIRGAVQDNCASAVGDIEGLRVTISVGASLNLEESDTLLALLDRADQALYRAKRTGRNRVAHFTPTGLVDAAPVV